MAKSALGRPRKWPENSVQVFSLRLPKELHAALRDCSRTRRQAINDLLLPVIEKWWAEQPESVSGKSEDAAVQPTSARARSSGSKR
jgi:hypothetical protein